MHSPIGGHLGSFHVLAVANWVIILMSPKLPFFMALEVTFSIENQRYLALNVVLVVGTNSFHIHYSGILSSLPLTEHLSTKEYLKGSPFHLDHSNFQEILSYTETKCASLSLVAQFNSFCIVLSCPSYTISFSGQLCIRYHFMRIHYSIYPF